MIKNVLDRNSLLLLYIFLILFGSSCAGTKHTYHTSIASHQVNYKGDSAREKILETAEMFIGTPYKYGGKTPSGFDCSGFTSYVMAKNGIALPPTSRLQARQGKKIAKTHARKGDLVFFENRGKINHVGIVKEVGKNKLYVVHATSSAGVRIDEIRHHPYWAKRLKFTTSVIE